MVLIATGAAAQFGYAKQADMTTRAIPNRFVELLAESIGVTVGRLQPGGARGGRRTPQPAVAGNRTVGGSTQHDFAAEGFAGLLEAAFGGVATTGAGPDYEHEYTIDELAWWTLQVAQIGDADTDKDAVGAMCNSATFTWDATGDGKLLAIQFEWMIHNLPTDQAMPVATYPVFTRLSSLDVSLTLDGTPHCVDSGSIKLTNNVDRQFEACAAHPGLARITDRGMRDVTGTLLSDASAGWARHGEYIAQDQVEFVFSAEKDGKGLEITSNVQWTGETKKVAGMGKIKQNLPFQAVGASDAEVITAVLSTTDATP